LSASLGTLVAHYGLVAVFILMALESACIPIPSEVVMPYAGYLAFSQALPFWAVVVTGTLANVAGSLVAYYVGSAGGRPFIQKYGRYILLNQKHVDKAELWFAKHGQSTVFVARLVPALRTFISLPAGIARMKLAPFIAYSLLGSLPWNFALAYGGYQLGKNWEMVGTYSKPLTYFGAVALVAAVLWFWFGRRKNRV